MTRNHSVMLSVLLGSFVCAHSAIAQNCPEAPPFIPIGGSIGPDGAWHPSAAPIPVRPTGGGPCVPVPSPQSTPPAAREVTTEPTLDPDRNAPIIDDAPASTAQASTRVGPQPWYAPLFEASDSVNEWAEETTTTGDVSGAVPVARGGGPSMVLTYYPRVLLSPVVRTYERPIRPVRVVVGGTFGAAAFTDHTGLWDVAYGWTATAGLQFVRVISLEGRYHGAWVPEYAANSFRTGVLGSGFAMVVRTTLPTRYVRPFVQAGVGYVQFDAYDAGQNRRVRGTAVEVPIGGGLELPLASCVSLTTEFEYHVLFNREFVAETRPASGDLWTATGGFRFYL